MIHDHLCDADVFDRGTVVAILGNISKQELQALVRGLQPFLADDVKIDWHYVAGRAVIKALGGGPVDPVTDFESTPRFHQPMLKLPEPDE